MRIKFFINVAVFAVFVVHPQRYLYNSENLARAPSTTISADHPQSHPVLVKHENQAEATARARWVSFNVWGAKGISISGGRCEEDIADTSTITAARPQPHPVLVNHGRQSEQDG